LFDEKFTKRSISWLKLLTVVRSKGGPYSATWNREHNFFLRRVNIIVNRLRPGRNEQTKNTALYRCISVNVLLYFSSTANWHRCTDDTFWTNLTKMGEILYWVYFWTYSKLLFSNFSNISYKILISETFFEIGRVLFESISSTRVTYIRTLSIICS